MISRKENLIQSKKGKQIKSKLLIGVLFLSLLVGSSIGVAFADSDINGLLTSWFNKKGTESITTIEQAIMTEKETQKERLKEELQIELQKSQEKLNEFTKQERNKRVEELKGYADNLIANMQIDNTDDEQQILAQLNSIIANSIEQMDRINSTNKPKEQSESNEKTKTDLQEEVVPPGE